MEENQRQRLRELPAVEEVLQAMASHAGVAEVPRSLLVEAARVVLEECRQAILAGTEPGGETGVAEIARQAINRAAKESRPGLRRVINATGVVLHTNLGRAPLGQRAMQGVVQAARGYSNLELDLESGRRGSRHEHVEGLLRRLTGAEAALVVNNNAAAVLLVLSALARGREVIASRGQLVEIGGSFRIPDVMAQSGARLVEVGTTNKTYLEDYRRAIGPDTAALLQVHTSNFRVVGFTHSVQTAELVQLGRQHHLPVLEDLGSGCLVDLQPLGLPPEPTVADAVAAGVDLVTFSGDKLLGGPQAGIIAGREEYVAPLRRHPLLRALRVDKMTLAGLAGTLLEYLWPDPQRRVPVLGMLAQAEQELAERAARLADLLSPAVQNRADLAVVPGASVVGGGALPTAELPAWLVVCRPRSTEAGSLAGLLRSGEPAVLARVEAGALLLDVRTVTEEELPELAQALAGALQKAGGA